MLPQVHDHVDDAVKGRQADTIEQDTRKQELASALFSGVGSTRSSQSMVS